MRESFSYVLVTAAHNEERLIVNTLDSVVAQTLWPRRWIVVSDGSTDATDEIVAKYAVKHPFIHLFRIAQNHRRNFGAQSRAINAGVRKLRDTEYDFIGNLDADVSFDRIYFAELLNRFHGNPNLGLIGGVLQEWDGTVYLAPKGEPLESVPQPIQFFRRACFDRIGEYPALLYGGADTYAEVMARKGGWEVRGYPDLVVHHHRYLATADGFLKGRFRQGRMDFSLGYDPIFQSLKCARRWRQRPVLVGALARMAGFLWSGIANHQRVVSDEFIQFLRTEQKRRLRSFLSARVPIL